MLGAYGSGNVALTFVLIAAAIAGGPAVSDGVDTSYALWFSGGVAVICSAVAWYLWMRSKPKA